MGWASLSVANRYIHPGDERVLAPFGQQPGQQPELTATGSNFGSNAPIAVETPMLELLLNASVVS